MKRLIEFIGGVVTSILASLVIKFLDVDLTTTQTLIIIVSICGITTIANTIITTINKKIDTKKNVK